MNRQFWIDTIIGTAFIFFIIAFAGGIFQAVEAFDPIGEALADMEITDYVFSKLREDPKGDTNVVVVNFGELPRGGIAEILKVINRYDPAVVGIDAFFYDLKENDPEGDSLLAHAFSETENLVIVSKLVDFNEETSRYQDVITSHPYFAQHASLGFANLETDAEKQDDMKVVRRFPPKYYINGEKYVSFGAKLAQHIRPKVTEKFLNRNNKFEIINFRGNIVDLHNASVYNGKFTFLDWTDVLTENFTPEALKDKIVIIGYAGRELGDTSWDDKFYTPVNQKIAGRANPDMFGVVVHANITAMILNKDFIDAMSETGGIILAVIMCYLNVLIFSWIYRRLPRWYDGMTKLIQLIEALVLIALLVIAFHYFDYKLNLTLTIIAILLAGDSLEVYYGVIKNLFIKERRRELFRLQYGRD